MDFKRQLVAIALSLWVGIRRVDASSRGEGKGTDYQSAAVSRYLLHGP
jgi:hypothetical protein